MKLKIRAALRPDSIDVPFLYLNSKDDEKTGYAQVFIDEETKTYEIHRISPDDEDAPAQVKEWLGEHYPGYQSV